MCQLGRVVAQRIKMDRYSDVSIQFGSFWVAILRVATGCTYTVKLVTQTYNGTQ